MEMELDEMTLEQKNVYACRYAWLRAHSWVENHPADGVIHFGKGYVQSAPNILDALIDANRSEGK